MQKIITKRKGNYFKVWHPKLFVLHNVAGIPIIPPAGSGGQPPWAPQNGQFMFWDGSPFVLASWADYLLTTPFHILLSLALKNLLRLMLRTDDTAPVLSGGHLFRHHWANPPAARLKYHSSSLPMSQSFLHDKWHFTGMTKQRICTRQGCIWDRLTSRCTSREISFDCLLHLSHSLARGLTEFQGAAQETGKRNSLGSYVQVFYASKEKYIGGIILTKHRTSDTGWNFHKS